MVPAGAHSRSTQWARDCYNWWFLTNGDTGCNSSLHWPVQSVILRSWMKRRQILNTYECARLRTGDTPSTPSGQPVVAIPRSWGGSALAGLLYSPQGLWTCCLCSTCISWPNTTSTVSDWRVGAQYVTPWLGTVWWALWTSDGLRGQMAGYDRQTGLQRARHFAFPNEASEFQTCGTSCQWPNPMHEDEQAREGVRHPVNWSYSQEEK